MSRIVYHVSARVDVLEIVEFYEGVEGPELADRFTKELEDFIKHISERPKSYREIRRGIRKASLLRFPHHVLFTVVDEETMKILAVRHDRRHPDFGLDR